MNDPTIAQRLGHFIHANSYEALPAHVVEQAKSRMLDSLGTALASRELPVPATALKFVAGSQGAASIYGHTQRVAAIDAAFVNATLINGTTHDDFLDKSHPGAVTIPAALAIAEERGSSGRDVLAAVVLGYDLVGRAYRGGPTMLPKFRATGVAGAIGAAAAAGKLQGSNADELASALGLAAMFASGFGEGFVSGTMDVKLNVGWACRSGVSAARLAQCGATAAPRVFEGNAGFFNAFAGNTDAAAEAVRDLGAPFLIEQSVYKERPVCIFVQTPVELVLALVDEHAIRAAAVERVVIHAPRATFTNPGFHNVAPFSTHLQARISARFTTAAALLGRPVGEYAFYYDIHDEEVLALAERIELVDIGPDADSIRVDIVHCGTTFTRSAVEMDSLFPTLDKSRAKFERVAGPWLGKRTPQVVDLVLGLDQLCDIRELTRLLRADAALA
ncbi:MmgE/PrpD family protein [Caballeronia sordidicola]|uniref:MmgE/PrpD family protein n=1 Tax=Caballeronia sordidicola TaxID=196367 RepID=A0A158GE64_CABSO|nr:MmgE/PrpD family protein [Caballeronia sordidicola]SAL30203.1 MmgE/PrpD family protein [Caballeronia sordidicola]